MALILRISLTSHSGMDDPTKVPLQAWLSAAQSAAGSAALPHLQAPLKESGPADRDGNWSLVKNLGITCALALLCTCNGLSMAVALEVAGSLQ